MDVLIGQTLHDRYEIQSLLGRQIGRRTFLAKDHTTDSSIVLKLLLFGPDFSWEDLKLFEREAEVLKSLNHPSIPQYLNFFEVDLELGKGFVLVQTYIEAKSLQEWIQAGRTFSQEELRSIAKQLLNILDYLHNRQPPVIHRDIKPSNILLGDHSAYSPGQIYLVDFGSVQTTTSHGGTRTIVGTYGYMPPEQFAGKSLPASDLYSLGATLIHLMTGQPPIDFMQDDMRINLSFSQNNDNDLISWLDGLTEPKLAQRLKTAPEALKALEQPPVIKRNCTSSRKCKKYLKKNTSGVFHWVVPATSKYPDILTSKLKWLFGTTSLAGLVGVTSLILFYWLMATITYSSIAAYLITNLVALNPWTIGFCLFILLGLIIDFKENRQRYLEYLTPFSETHFTIDRKRIIIEHYFWSKSWKTLDLPRELIRKIHLKPKYLQPYMSHGEGGRTKPIASVVEASLEIQLDTQLGPQRIKVPGTSQFNENELEWLAHELATCLNQEVQVMSFAELTPYPQLDSPM
jgi:serine/threonine protein kinase